MRTRRNLQGSPCVGWVIYPRAHREFIGSAGARLYRFQQSL